MSFKAERRPRGRERGVALILVVILMVVTVVLGGVLIAVPHEGLKREVGAECKERAFLASDAGVGEALVKIISGAITPSTSLLTVPSTGTTAFGKNGGGYWYTVILTGTNIKVNSHGVVTDMTSFDKDKTVEAEVEVLLKYPAPDPPGISGMVSDGFPFPGGGPTYGFMGRGELTGLNLDMGGSGDTTGSPTTDLYGMAQSQSEPSQGWWFSGGWPDWGITGKDASGSQMDYSLGTNSTPAHPALPSPAPRNSPCSAAGGLQLPAPTTEFYTTGGASSIRDMPNGDGSVSQPAGTFSVSSLSAADRGSSGSYKLRIVRPTALPTDATAPVVKIDADFYGILAVDFSKNLNTTTSFLNSIFRTENGATMNGILFMETGIGDSSGATTSTFSKPIFSQLGPPSATLEGTVNVTTTTTLTGTGTNFSFSTDAQGGTPYDILTFPGVSGSFRVTGVTNATTLTLDAAPGTAINGVTATAAPQITGTVNATGTNSTLSGGTGANVTQFHVELPVSSTLRLGTSSTVYTVLTVAAAGGSCTVSPNPPSITAASNTKVKRITPTMGGALKGCVIYEWNCDLGSGNDRASAPKLCLGDTATHRPGTGWPHNAPPHTTMGPGMQYRLGIVAAAMGALADKTRLNIASYRVVN